MSATMEKLSSNQVKLTVTVSAEEFDKAMNTAYGKLKGRLSVPGFRKGKAPRKVIENYYGAGVLVEEAFNTVLPESYDKAVEETGAKPVAQPEIDIESIGAGEDCVYTATVYVRPEVTLGQYKGVAAPAAKWEVTEDQINAEIDRAAERVSRMAEVTDRAAQMGDTANINYAGSVDGVAFEGGTAENTPLELGSGMFIPGFESQLVGAHAGSDVLVTVTFPKDYRATELAGKPAEFRCHIVEVREKSAYELDDVFAKEVGGCQTLEEMKQKLRQSLQDYYDERAEMEVQDTLMRQAAATLDYTPSAQELKEGIDAQVELLKAQLGRKGLTLEAYLQFTGKTEQQIRDDAKPEAENSLRIQKSAERIALLEGLTATDEDYANELAAICRQNGLTMEQLKPHMNAQFEASVRDNIRMKKAIAFVRANADVTVVDAPASKD